MIYRYYQTENQIQQHRLRKRRHLIQKDELKNLRDEKYLIGLSLNENKIKIESISDQIDDVNTTTAVDKIGNNHNGISSLNGTLLFNSTGQMEQTVEMNDMEILPSIGAWIFLSALVSAAVLYGCTSVFITLNL